MPSLAQGQLFLTLLDISTTGHEERMLSVLPAAAEFTGIGSNILKPMRLPTWLLSCILVDLSQ
jgi:hypothetical protein